MTLPDALVLVHDRTVGGGAELALLAILAQCRDWGMETHLVTGRPGELHGRFEAATDRRLVVPFRYRRQPASWLRLPRFLKEGRRFVAAAPERRVVWAGDVYDLWAASKLGPAVSQFQGEFDFDSDASLRKWRKYGARRAARLVASRPVAAFAAGRGMRVHALDPRVDAERFAALPPRDELRRRFGLAPEDRMCLCVGRLDEAKGQPWLLERFLAHPTLPKEWRLWFAGTATGADAARFRAAPTCVRWLGWRDDVPELMRAADLMVLPGTFMESFSMVCAESLLAGTPLLALDTGALPRVHPLPELRAPPAERARLLDLWAALTRERLASVRERWAPRDAYDAARWQADLRAAIAGA